MVVHRRIRSVAIMVLEYYFYLTAFIDNDELPTAVIKAEELNFLREVEL